MQGGVMHVDELRAELRAAALQQPPPTPPDRILSTVKARAWTQVTRVLAVAAAVLVVTSVAALATQGSERTVHVTAGQGCRSNDGDVPHRVVDELARGDFAAVFARFDAPMANAVSERHLESTWKNASAQLGNCVAVVPGPRFDKGPYTVADLEVRFQQGALLIRTATRGDRISGLLVLPTGEAQIPSDPAGQQLRWVLQILNGSAPPTDTDITSHFGPDFLKVVASEKLRATLAQLQSDAPWRLVCVTATASGNELKAGIVGVLSEVSVTLAVEPNAPSRMTGLIFQTTTKPCG